MTNSMAPSVRTDAEPPQPLSDTYDPSPEGFKRRLARIASLVGSQNALAKQAHIPQSTIRKYFGRGEAPSLTVIALAHAAQVRPEWLFTGSGPMLADDHKYDEQKIISATDDVAFLPLYYAQHSKPLVGNILEDFAEIVDFLPFKRNWLKLHVSTDPNHIALIHVAGDSMEPLLRDGEVVFIDRTQNEIQEGVYALIILGHLAIKRLHLDRSTIRIVSEHKSYSQIEIPMADAAGRLQLVGRVFGNIQHIF